MLSDTTVQLPPFVMTEELVHWNAPDHFQSQTIPNQLLNTLSQDSVDQFLKEELETAILDELHGYLWLVATKSGRHIDALHKQVIKQRTVTVAEDPNLHLTWYYNTVYLKPIPHCLLSHTFWRIYVLPNLQGRDIKDIFDTTQLPDHCRTALGFLRSYGFLIEHESDFAIAQAAGLVPNFVSYIEFQCFIHRFRSLPDNAVSIRYHYGQLRLSRLNWAVRLIRPVATGKAFPLAYQQRYWQTGQHLQRLGAPTLFMFAALSLILSSMQVILAALGSSAWATVVRASLGFSIATIILIIVTSGCALLGISVILLHQLQYGIRMKRKEEAARASHRV
jgi:hypothetical protein